MDFIQPIFVNQTSDIVQGKLGPDNASFPIQKINEIIQKDIDVGVEDFLLFVTPNKKTNGRISNTIEGMFNSVNIIG